MHACPCVILVCLYDFRCMVYCPACCPPQQVGKANIATPATDPDKLLADLIRHVCSLTKDKELRLPVWCSKRRM